MNKDEISKELHDALVEASNAFRELVFAIVKESKTPGAAIAMLTAFVHGEMDNVFKTIKLIFSAR